jgi:tRNA(Met) cytidine acetyltransferase
MPQPTDIAQLIDELTVLSEELAKLGQRQIVLLAGDLDWGWAIACRHAPTYLATPKGSDFEKLLPESHGLELARPDKPTTLLGFESQHIVMDAHSGFYPDALCAIAGTIEPGGFLFVLCPKLDEWPNSEDGFAAKRTSFGFTGVAASPNTIQRFIGQIESHGGVIVEQSSCGGALFSDNALAKIAREHAPTSRKREPVCPMSEANALGAAREWKKPTRLTDQQQSILDTITADLAENKGFHIIQADRGRGKSHLLGLIAHSILDSTIDNGIKCILTGPNKASVKSVYKGFDTASQSKLFACEQAPTDLGARTLEFVAPEDVLDNVDSDSILIVDEAASLPIPILKSWAKVFGRIIFATTTHGYEGTGKGFQIRFLEFLNTLDNSIHQHQLTHPIRYADKDPVEQTLFKTFCLDSEPKGLGILKLDQQHIQICEIQQSELAADSELLEDVFSLLVQAHYQTRPSDLRDILDAPSIRIFASFTIHDSHSILIGACLVFDEGNFSEANEKLIEAIANGKRRPKGHLVPQVLTLHMGQKNALKLKSARVVRIATLPNLQRNNIGSQILNFVGKTLIEDHYDFISSSYADTEDVRSFWLKNQFSLVRLGNKFDQSSGTRSGLVLHGLSENGKKLEIKCSDFFENQTQNYSSVQDLNATDRLLVERFIDEVGSYDAVKDILIRCSDWQEHFKTKQFPKKAGKDFRELVKNWHKHKAL